ncbi:unnamed protein product [Rhizoctonia solani]|uniref:Protein kinase domain-containing protein n=1 Tax=Rhizoctonia solani TaxID=456999 RepID=A0A8H3DU31_9AGAM|nr:unnamed protein product [Rhizoctonia solani]
MSNASDLEIVEETPAPQSQPAPNKSAIPKRKAKNSTGAAQPASSDGSSSTKKPKQSNNSSNGPTGAASKAAMEALRQENEDLKRQLAESNKLVDRFQDDFAKLQNLRLSAPEQSLREYIMKAEEREKQLHEQNQMLIDKIPILERLIRPHESGTVTLLTREETDGKIHGYRTEIVQLRGQIENLKRELESVTQSLSNTQLELDEEIKRGQALSQQLSERPSRQRGHDSDNSKDKELKESQLKLAFYEDLTTIKVHSTKQFLSDEYGLITEMECDCTTYQKTLYFKLHMYKTEAVVDGEPDPNTLVDTVRYFPIGLENEKDKEFLEGLGILTDPFTFVKENAVFDRQMWEFCMEINNGVTRWKDGGVEEEEEEEEGEGEGDAEDAGQTGRTMTSSGGKRSIKWIKGALIGSGSFGSVYLGMDAVQGLLMAVKQVELPTGSSTNEERKKSMLTALEREIELLKQLQHENIVQYLDSSIDTHHLNIFLEYVPGGSVATLLRNYGAFEEPLARNWVRQILQGLNYLHEREIIHRDIKGGNILVDNKGGIKISDFGISKKVEDNLLGSRIHRPSLQGSVFWMAPEVVKQTSYTYKADIWSVGCLVVEMLTGQHPWAQLTQMQAIFKIGSLARPTIPPDISPEAEDFLNKTFELDYNIRPTAAELLSHPWVQVGDTLGANAAAPDEPSPAITNDAIDAGTIPGIKINLKVLSIGNGMTDPHAQYPEFVRYAVSNPYQRPLVNDSVLASANNSLYAEPDGCLARIQRCNNGGTDTDCSLAQAICNGQILEPFSGDYDVYDVRVKNPNLYPYNPTALLRNTTFMAQIGALSTWQAVSYEVYYNFAGNGDWMRSSSSDLERVIDAGVRTLILAGDADYICNYMGVEATVDALQTKFTSEYQQQGWSNWTVSGYPAGIYKNAGTFSYLRVHEAGHEVPAYGTDQLEVGQAALEYFIQAMQGKPISST